MVVKYYYKNHPIREPQVGVCKWWCPSELIPKFEKSYIIFTLSNSHQNPFIRIPRSFLYSWGSCLFCSSGPSIGGWGGEGAFLNQGWHSHTNDFGWEYHHPLTGPCHIWWIMAPSNTAGPPGSGEKLKADTCNAMAPVAAEKKMAP